MFEGHKQDNMSFKSKTKGQGQDQILGGQSHGDD